MSHFTIRDLLWPMMVVGMGVALWIATWHAYEQEAERKLWQVRSEQLKSQVEQSGDAIVEFLPTRTSVAFGKKATKPQGINDNAQQRTAWIVAGAKQPLISFVARLAYSGS